MLRIEKDASGNTLYHVAIDLLLIKDGKVLLQRRKNTGWMDGKWNLFGGHPCDDEVLEETIVREAKEELGIEIKPKDIHIVHCIQHRSTSRLYMQFYATCEKYKGTPTIMEDKADTLEWFDVNDLPKEIVPTAKQAIKSYANKKHFSRFGFGD
jgi:8-oxo-dGTP pyrophosphatase MutT (NUDIX family)